MRCLNCDKSLIRANGKVDSNILVVGDYPGVDEVKTGLPFAGKSGKVLQYEMGRIGFPLQTCRVTSLWLHYKPENKELKRNQPCLDYSFSFLLEELKQPRKGVLMLGSDLSDAFGVELSDVLGLPLNPKTGSALLQMINSNVVVFTYSPAYAFHSGIGEIRLSLEKFRRAVKNDMNTEETNG